MKNTELAELILKKLYDFAETEGHGYYASLLQIAHIFGEKDEHKVRNLAFALRDRGLIHPEFMANDIIGCITGEGSLFVEEGGNTGVIQKYEIDPTRFHINIDQSTHFHGNVTGSNVAVNSDIGQQVAGSAAEIKDILKSIIDLIHADASLNPIKKEELLSDVVTLEKEIVRGSPRKGVIKEIISTFGSISSIASLAAQLSSMLPL